MINSFYKTVIYTNTANVIGVNITQNTIDKIDFETNYKSTAIGITDATFFDTSLSSVLDFTVFKTKVSNWDDVRYLVRDNNRYEIFTLQNTPIDQVKVDITSIQSGTVNIGSIVNDANIFLSDIAVISSKNATTLRTYTVPAGKSFRLVAWQVNLDHPVAIDIILYINDVAKLKFYLDPSNGNDSNYIYTAPVKIANAGDVLTIKFEPTMPRGEINSVLVGIES